MTSGESPGIPQRPASNMQSKQSSRLRTLFKERHEQVFTCVRGDIPYEFKAKYITVLPLRENKDDKNDFSIHHKSVKTSSALGDRGEEILEERGREKGTQYVLRLAVSSLRLSLFSFSQ